MSELKVNKVTPRSGTTVTLGDSGDSVAIPTGVGFNGFNFRNRIINGDMQVAQRGTSVTVNDNASFFAMDRWQCLAQTSDGVYTVAQSSTAPTGFVYSLLATVTTADASLGATQSYPIRQRIEGFNISDLMWGTANAKTITLSFWVRSSLTGTFGGALINGDFVRAYPFTYEISAANTFEYKTITIAGDTTGTWSTDNSTGVVVSFSLGDGSTRLGTAGAWVGSNKQGVTGQTNVIATSGATFYITGVQLEAGTTASDFEFLPIDVSLGRCQRYYFLKASGIAQDIGMAAYYTSTDLRTSFCFPTTMRTTPSVDVKTVTNGYDIRVNGAPDSMDDFVINNGSTHSISILNNTDVSGTAGQCGHLFTNNAGSFLALDAEL
jgi:hypothetical protein